MATTPYRERVQATIFLSPNMSIDAFDYLTSDGDMRVIGVHIGDLTVYVRHVGGDADVVATTDRLTAALFTLRDAAMARMQEAAA